MSVSAICRVLHDTVVGAAATFPQNPSAMTFVLHLTARAIQVTWTE